MKKILLSLITAALASVSMTAQNNVTNNPDNKSYIGFRLGGEITCPGDISFGNISISPFKSGGGIEFVGIYNLPVIGNFFIEPGLGFYYNAYSMKDYYIGEVEDELHTRLWNFNFTVNSLSIRKFGLRVPVMAGYNFKFTNGIKISVFTGPELEAGIIAKEYIKGRGLKYIQTVYDEGGEMNRIDVLWGIGAGITYRQFYFGIKGSIGMCNMLRDIDAKFHENRVTFSIGYNLE